MRVDDHITPSSLAAHSAARNSPRRLTFDELCERDLRLTALRDEIARLPRVYPNYCANAAWFGLPGYKRRMSRIVGYLAVQFDPDLRTSEAYDTAYHALYHALPDCDHDSFCRWEPVIPGR